MTEICEKYGRIDHITLKTNVLPDGNKTSKGIAIVQYASSEEANLALKNLIFEEALGDPSRIKIEFYESRETRQSDFFSRVDPIMSQELAHPILFALKEKALDQLLSQSTASTEEQMLVEDFEAPDYIIKPIPPPFVM